MKLGFQPLGDTPTTSDPDPIPEYQGQLDFDLPAEEEPARSLAAEALRIGGLAYVFGPGLGVALGGLYALLRAKAAADKAAANAITTTAQTVYNAYPVIGAAIGTSIFDRATSFTGTIGQPIAAGIGQGVQKSIPLLALAGLGYWIIKRESTAYRRRKHFTDPYR